MPGYPAACALLALCLADRLWRCAADCDAKIINSLKAKHGDPTEFDGIFENSVIGEYHIVLMATSTQNLAGRTGDSCLRMRFKRKYDSGMNVEYSDGGDNGDFPVTYTQGALESAAKDAKGPVMLTHRFVYFSREVLAFYVCTDAGDDPSLSVVAVSSWFSTLPQLVAHQVRAARQALEQEGIRGFATVPPC